MALGDGIRRNVTSVSQQERDRFRDAIIALNNEPEHSQSGWLERAAQATCAAAKTQISVGFVQ